MPFLPMVGAARQMQRVIGTGQAHLLDAPVEELVGHSGDSCGEQDPRLHIGASRCRFSERCASALVRPRRIEEGERQGLARRRLPQAIGDLNRRQVSLGTGKWRASSAALVPSGSSSSPWSNT